MSKINSNLAAAEIADPGGTHPLTGSCHPSDSRTPCDEFCMITAVDIMTASGRLTDADRHQMVSIYRRIKAVFMPEKIRETVPRTSHIIPFERRHSHA